MKPLETLVSMTDFVFHLRNMTTSELCKTYPKNFKTPVWNGNQSDMVKDMLAIDAIQWKLTGEYAKFLKQPLTLGMFVPVSEAGEVLKGKPLSPAPDAEWIRWENEEEEYNKAKSRCLFEGFDGFEKSYVSDGLYFLVNKQENVECILSDTYSIENLVDMDLTLTPYAKELIYGN